MSSYSNIGADDTITVGLSTLYKIPFLLVIQKDAELISPADITEVNDNLKVDMIIFVLSNNEAIVMLNTE